MWVKIYRIEIERDREMLDLFLILAGYVEHFKITFFVQIHCVQLQNRKHNLPKKKFVI